MRFPFNIYLFAGVSGFAASLLSLPLWSRWCFRVGLVDEPGQRKTHQRATPLAGGIAIATGLVIPLLLGSIFVMSGLFPENNAELHNNFSTAALDSNSAYLLRYGLRERAWRLLGIVTGAIGILVVGLLDDKFELSAPKKFLGQVLVATLVAVSGVRITLFVHSLVFQYVITILWIITVLNALNFMDNMNGLCSGLTGCGALYFGLIAAASGQYLVASISFLSSGAILGFLPYNFPGARAFLGDSGSHLLGYLLAVLAIVPHFYMAGRSRPGAVLIPLLVLAVPLIDLVCVVVIRWWTSQPIYLGDTNHLSHRLVRAGLSQTRAVLLIWLMAAFLGGTALVLAI